MATRSSIFAWKILWTEEPGWLQFMGSQSQTRLNTHMWHIRKSLKCFPMSEWTQGHKISFLTLKHPQLLNARPDGLGMGVGSTQWDPCPEK